MVKWIEKRAHFDLDILWDDDEQANELKYVINKGNEGYNRRSTETHPEYTLRKPIYNSHLICLSIRPIMRIVKALF